MDQPRYVSIGYVRRAHGVRGLVLVESLTDNEARFSTLSEAFLEIDGARKLLRVVECRASSNGWLVRFEGVEERNQAESLKGGYLQVDAEELPELDEGRYYLFELVGMDVYTLTGEHLGVLVEVQQYPANDVYVVRGDRGTLLLPAITDVVKRIDRQSKRMEVELLDGLDYE